MAITGTTIALLILSVFFVTGLFIGWALVKKRYILLVIGLIILAPVIETTIFLDHPAFTLPVVIGFLIHTAKPIYQGITGR